MRLVQFRYRKCKSNRINLGVEIERGGDVIDLKPETGASSLVEWLETSENEVLETAKR